MSAAISTKGLTKYYGKTVGIVDLDLEVAEGEVFGFLGPNGAGKSTTIRLLLSLIYPTRGSARILGLDMRNDSLAIRHRVGYLPGDLAMYHTMTGRQLVAYFSALRGVDTTARTAELSARLELDLDRLIGSYSTGNRQKVGIVQAMAHGPELLILDEPTAGLDPLMQQEFYAMVEEAKQSGATIFLSSHILPEVERIADRVGIVRSGHLVAMDSVDDLKAKALRRVELVFAESIDVEEFRRLPSVHHATVGGAGHELSVSVAGSLAEVMAVAGRHAVTNVVTHEGDLEEAFLAYYSGEDGDAA
jgi:ABC-2 type transport system ATP-binding protein